MVKYTDEIKSLNLYEKIAAISDEIGYLQKDDRVGIGQNQYKAISSEKVLNIVSEKMCKYGVVAYPLLQKYVRTDERVIAYDKFQKKEVEKINRISDVETTYRFINIHNPTEFLDVVGAGTGVDTQDKGIGKAQTYAYKNMLLKVFIIATGEDSDKVHSDDYSNKLKEIELNNEAQNLNKTQWEAFMEIAKTKDSASVVELLKAHGYKKSTEILVKDYAKIMEQVKLLEQSK